VLGRAIDFAALVALNGQLSAGVSRAAVAGLVINSAEARGVLVQGFYQRLLRRSADPGGLNHFVTALGSGMRDEQVAATLAVSDEYFGRV
jgi:hypothetical protein